MKPKKWEPFVKAVLEEDIYTRENDHLLYVKVLYKINATLSTCNFKDIFVNYESYMLPPFCTIERNARKVKEKYPKLKPEKEIQEARLKKQDEFIEYALDL